MSEMTLKPNEKLDVRNILKDLDKYEPKRRGWTWRKPAPNLEMGPFTYHDVSEPLKQSVGLPPAKYFGDIDPQPLPVITTEIASAALRTISAACAWPPGTAPTTSWSSGIWASPTSTA